MHRLRLGLAVVAAAPAAWLIGVLALGFTDYVVPLLVILAGAALAVWAVPSQRRAVGAASLALAAVGVALFYDFDLLGGLANRAGAIVLLGLAIGATAVAVDTPRGLAAGSLVVASGGMLWLYVDGSAWEWQVGNVLLVAGSVATAVAAWRVG